MLPCWRLVPATVLQVNLLLLTPQTALSLLLREVQETFLGEVGEREVVGCFTANRD